MSKNPERRSATRAEQNDEEARGSCGLLLAAVQDQPGRTRHQLARATGISPSTAYKTLTRLREQQLVECRGSAQKPSQRGRRPHAWYPAMSGGSARCAHRRRRAGELQRQVLDYLRADPDTGGQTVFRIARGVTAITRHSASVGAVTNAVSSLCRTGRARLVTENPARYSATDDRND